jgi:putative transposase
MLLTHKIQLVPNNKQAGYFAQAAGVSRFAYNWALDEWQRQYEAGERPSEISLRKQLNGIKREQFPWMLEVTKSAPQQAVKNLGTAFDRFFKKQGKYPRFKKKGVHDSFRADDGPAAAGCDAVRVEGNRIKLARIGWVRMTETVRLQGQIKSVTISRKAGRWFAAINVDTPALPHARKNQASAGVAQAVGVDLGITRLAVLSTGVEIAGPKALKKALSRIRFLNKELSRRKKGSKNWLKTKAKLAQAHYRVACVRNDALHKLTTELVLNHAIIGIEDLNVAGMMKNRHLSRAIADQGFGEFRRQIAYKSEWYGVEVVIYPRFKPSSKMCCACGEIHEMPFAKRTLNCPCDNTMDRDLNAAINIKNYAVSTTVCGGDSAGLTEDLSGETMPVKQETNSYQ